jgi:thioesterase domain-containing protein
LKSRLFFRLQIGALLLRTRHFIGNVIIQDSSIQYLRPVISDFEASSEIPAEHQLDEFLKMLRRRAKSRLLVHVSIFDSSGVAVAFSGRYIASLT